MINVLLALMIIVSFLGAISLHEFGHAITAYWLGDQSARAEGRLTLNLRSHIDSMGLLLCIVMAFQPVLATPMALGWGKPVKPDPWKMRIGANAGVLVVACAGPLFSLMIGLVTAVIAHFSYFFLYTNNPITPHILQFLLVFAVVNISLAFFNLFPFYPLDGYQILYTLLPSKQAAQFARSAPYGTFIILILFFFLPFLAGLAGSLSSFPLFHLAYYIWAGSITSVGLVFGPFPGSFDLISSFYYLR